MLEKKDKATSKAEPQAGHEFYQVDQILDKRLTTKGMMYLIKWKNYPDPKDYTWQPISHLTEVEDLVKEFNQNHEQRTNGGRKQPIKPEQAPRKATKVAKKQEQDGENQSEEATSKEREPKRRSNRKDKSNFDNQVDKKYIASANEEEPEEQESKLIRIKPKKRKDTEEKHQNEGFDRYWEKQGLQLGRIHRHYVDGKTLIFNVNINKGDLVCGSVYLTLENLKEICESRLLEYMETWAKLDLIEKRETATSEFKDFEEYWRSVK